MQIVVMPKKGMTMNEGTIISWFKGEGEKIEKGEVLVEVTSDKMSFEIEAPCTGKVASLLYPINSTVPIGEEIAIIFEEGEVLDSKHKQEKNFFTNEQINEEIILQQPEPKMIRATPVAKKLAKQLGIDLSKVLGSGPVGRIKEQDVRNYHERMIHNSIQQQVAVKSSKISTEEEIIPFTGMRKILAQNVRNSLDTAVHVTSTTEVDLTELLKLRGKLVACWEGRYPERLTVNAFFIKAVAIALKEHPSLNCSLVNENLILKKFYHIGLAVSSGDDLLVPVIHNADRLTVREIAGRIQDLSAKGKQGKLTLEDMEGGTFTITNVGPFGVQIFTPVIVPPQGAILGIGTTTERPVVHNGEIKIRSICNLCLSYDHRIIQGVPAAKFRLTIKELLEKPLVLLS